MKRAEAEKNTQRVKEIFSRLADDFPNEPEYRRRLADSLIILGLVVRDRGDWAAAAEHYRAALGLQTQLVAERPESADYRNRQADSRWALAYK